MAKKAIKEVRSAESKAKKKSVEVPPEVAADILMQMSRQVLRQDRDAYYE